MQARPPSALDRAGLGPRRPGRDRHHQPARDDRAVGPAHRRAGAPRDRLAGHPHRRLLVASWPGTAGRTGSATAAACRWRPTSPARRSAGCSTRPELRAPAEEGEILFGTIDTWLIWNLTGRARHRRHQRQPHHADEPVHAGLGRRAAGRASACRGRCCRRSADRRTSTAKARGPLHGVPVAGALGDQQAALFGQACFEPGRSQVHLRHRRLPAAQHGHRRRSERSAASITTVAYQLGGEPPVYALEGSIAVDRLARAVAARQPRADPLERRDRRAGRVGRRTTAAATSCRRSPGSSPRTGVRRARHHRRPDRLRHEGAPRPGRARGDRVAGPRGRRRHGRRLRCRHRCAQGGRWHDRQRVI